MPTEPAAPLSVVIPTRDTRDLVRRAVASVLREAPAAEVLVVDDGSVDDTAAALAAAFPAIQILRQSAARGYAHAANAGLARARGEVLLLLNSDAELQPGAPAALAAALAAAPSLGVAGGRLSYPDGRAQWSGGREPDWFWLFALASGWGTSTSRLRRRILRRGAGGAELEIVDWVSGAAMALRRGVYSALGPLDEGYGFYCQDLDYCRRAAAAGWTVAVVSGFRVLHVHGATVAGADGGGQRLDLLWPDLVRWARRARGPAGERAARRALLWGSLLRRGAGRSPGGLRAARRALRAPLPVD